MNAITATRPVAMQILADIWSNSRNHASLSAVRWFYSEAGSEAFIAFACRLFDGSDAALSRAIFALQVEIAARKAGWCPELDSPENDQTSTDYQ